MSRWKKAVKVAAVTGAVAVGAGGYVLTKKMFVDRHAIVSLLFFLYFKLLKLAQNSNFANSKNMALCKFKCRTHAIIKHVCMLLPHF